MSRKLKRRIYNPKSGKYYEIKEITIKKGTKNQIKGLWKNKKRKWWW